MIQIEIGETEDTLRLAVLQNGHQIGHPEALSRSALPELELELDAALSAVRRQIAAHCTEDT